MLGHFPLLASAPAWQANCPYESRSSIRSKVVPMSEKLDKAGINIFVRREDVLACLYGCIDIDSSPAVRDRLLALLNAPHLDAVTIDLSAVTHIDSSGVATLIEALKIARGYETELRLSGLDDRLRRLFEITGILSLFNGEQRNMNELENKVV
jgi:anti-sigma B factor antagonist